MAPDRKALLNADSSSESVSESSSSSSSCLSEEEQGGGIVSSWSSKRTYGLVAEDISSMVRKRRKRTLEENLSVLRSITHSSATRKSCIISDAFKYIEELKQRVRELNRDLAAEVDSRQRELLGSHTHETGRANSGPSLPTVTVVSKECGLEIHVSCEKRPGLLIAVLEAVEALGINVLQARVSCKDYFLFEALSGEDKQGKIAEPHIVKEALLQVIYRINPEKTSPRGSEVMD
ncbi:hypothetical protein KI387_023388, partial [Taxus chinensis]